MAGVFDQIKYQFKSGGMYITLIYVNVGVAVLTFMLFPILGELMKWSVWEQKAIMDNFVFNTDPETFIKHPWTIITYMFMHGNWMHLIMNMLVLFFMGQIFERYIGKKQVLSTYIIGGIIGAAFEMIAHNTFPLYLDHGPIGVVGASAAAMAILAGAAAYAPNIELYLFGVVRMKLIWLAGLYALMDLISLGNGDNVAHFAHLGGAAWGFIAMSQLRKGKNISSWFDKFISFFTGLFSRKPKMKVAYSKHKSKKRTKSSKQAPPRDDYSYNEEKVNKQEKLDAILDKLKQRGYDGLTKEEKDFLAKF